MPDQIPPSSSRPAHRADAYLRTRVMTASPAELRLMLIDGAIRFARQGRQGLIDRDYEAAYNGITQSQAIMMELINALDHDQDPTLCERLAALYTWMYRQMMDASTRKDPAPINDVIRLLNYERDTQALVVEKLKDQSTGGMPPDAAALSATA